MYPQKRGFWTRNRITGAIVVPLFGIGLIRNLVVMSQTGGAYRAGVVVGTMVVLVIVVWGVIYLVRG